MLEYAADFGPEDGTDPVAFHDRRKWHTKPPGEGRKARQLCEQVADAVRLILPGLADPGAEGLAVVAVDPAPHAGRLMVTVAGPAPADVAGRRAAELALGRITPALRSAVGGMINRRKVPELVLCLQ